MTGLTNTQSSSTNTKYTPSPGDTLLTALQPLNRLRLRPIILRVAPSLPTTTHPAGPLALAVARQRRLPRLTNYGIRIVRPEVDRDGHPAPKRVDAVCEWDGGVGEPVFREGPIEGYGCLRQGHDLGFEDEVTTWVGRG